MRFSRCGDCRRAGRFLVAVLVAALATPAAAVNYTWNSAVDANWSDSASWNPVGAPAGVADSVFFGATGGGTTNTLDIVGLSVDLFSQTQDNFTTDLVGNTLTVNTLNLLRAAPSTVTGTLTITGDPGSLLHVTTAMTIGSSTASSAIVFDATMTLAADAALQVGVGIGSRAPLFIGYSTVNNTTTGGTASLTAGDEFNGHITNLSVGHRTTGPGGTITNLTGELDLSAVTVPGVLDVSGDFLLGQGKSTAGTLKVSDAVDVKIGSDSVRGGQLVVGNGLSLPAPSELLLGTGDFHAYVTNVTVGRGPSPGVATLDASNVSAGILNISGNVSVGERVTSAGAMNATVVLGDGVDAVIGSATSRSNVLIGDGASGAASVQAGSGLFTAYLNNLTVGVSHASGVVTGSLGLSAISGGLLDVAGNVIIAGTSSLFTTVSDNGRAANGSVILSDNFDTKLGAASARGTLSISVGDRTGVGSFITGGTFNAYLTTLAIGHNTGTNASTASGTMNLLAVNVGTLNVSGEVIVGKGQGAQGTLRLPAFSASADILTVGGTQGAFLGRGLVELDGTVFSIASGVTLDGPSAALRSIVSGTIAGASAGLSLAGTATLTVNEGLIALTFLPPTSLDSNYWGLRWVGDHVTDLTALYDASKLTWDDTALVAAGFDPVSIFLDEGVTYVGIVVPEPASLMLIVLGLALVSGHRRWRVR